METILQPQVPYLEAFSRNLTPGRRIQIYGIINTGSFRFHINLQCGANDTHLGNIALQIAVNVLEADILVNSMSHGVWDEPHKIRNIPIKFDEEFEIVIICDFDKYKLLFNGQQFCQFTLRFPHDHITHLAINGDVILKKIVFEMEPTEPTICRIQPLTAQPVGLAQQSKSMYNEPPPSYSEAQANTFSSMCGTYQSTGSSTANGVLVPILPGREQHLNQNTNTGELGVMMPLNAASSNFRPVKPSNRKKIISYVCCIAIVIIIILLVLMNKGKTTYNNRHHRNNFNSNWDY